MRLRETVRRPCAAAWRAFRRGRRRAAFLLAPPPIILCYHRVFAPETDPHLLCVRPERFRAHLEIIRRLAQPLHLDQLIEAREQRRLPRRGLVITFDDGYVDNLENALPILRATQVPATIYVATGATGTTREFWWDDLARLILGALHFPEILRLEIDGQPRTWPLGALSSSAASWNVLASGAANARQSLFCELHAALRPLPQPAQEAVLEQLRSLTGTPVAARPGYRGMTGAELNTIAADPLITLGAHTLTHCDLAFWTAEEQAEEIEGSRRQLQDAIGREVTHFSYPYGSFNEDAIAVCARGNFRSAVTCLEGPVERATPPHCLPRFLVRDWDGPEFEQRLRYFFRG